MKNLTKLLVIEDDFVMLTLISKVLQQAGYHIITAQNGKEAKRCIEEEVYDLVVMDIYMPYQSGFSLIEDIKSRLSAREKPVVVVTSFANSDTLAVLSNLTVSAVLQKPFTAQELTSAVEGGLAYLPAPVSA